MHRLKPLVDPLAVQIIAMLIAGLIVVSATVLTSQTIHNQSYRAAHEAEAATLSAQIDSHAQTIRTYLDLVQAGHQVELLSALSIHDEVRAIVDDTDQLIAFSDLPGAVELRLPRRPHPDGPRRLLR